MKVRGKALRTGWTTGTCSAAAAKAASIGLSSGDSAALGRHPAARRRPHDARRRHPARSRPGRATRRRHQGRRRRPRRDARRPAHRDGRLARDARASSSTAASGVGVVTKPGLGLEVGGPAINPVPRAQITQAVGEAIDLTTQGVRVVISVPDGERMARKTTNGRLGILGGISILGTTGIVRPFSTASWRASVMQAVDVLAAQGESTVVLATGGRTEKAAMTLYPELAESCFVEVGDFTGAALRRARAGGLQRVIFVGMVGKLTKLAAGVLMTHYTRSAVDRELLAAVTAEAGGDAGTGRRPSRRPIPPATPTKSGNRTSCSSPPATRSAAGCETSSNASPKAPSPRRW